MWKRHTSMIIEFLLIFCYFGLPVTLSGIANVSDHGRQSYDASPFEEKEIQPKPRQMQFFHWLFGDHTREEPKNRTKVTDSDKLELFPRNRTRSADNPHALPIDWSVVLKEFVKPLHENETVLENSQNTTLIETSKYAHQVFNTRNVTNGSEAQFGTNSGNASSRNSKQFFNHYAPIHRRQFYKNWAHHQRPQQLSNGLYQRRNRPIYNIYNNGEENNGFEESDESSDYQNNYFDMLREQYRTQGWQTVPISYKNSNVNHLMDGGMQGSLPRENEDTVVAEALSESEDIDEPTRFYEDYEESNIETPIRITYETVTDDDDDPDFTNSEPEVQRSFPVPSVNDKQWGKNCKGSQCSRQAIPVDSSNNSSSSGNSTIASNSATVTAAPVSNTTNVAAPTSNTTNPVATSSGNTTNVATPSPVSNTTNVAALINNTTAVVVPVSNTSITNPTTSTSLNPNTSTAIVPTNSNSSATANMSAVTPTFPYTPITNTSTPTSPSPSISTSTAATPTPAINNAATSAPTTNAGNTSTTVATLPNTPSNSNVTQSISGATSAQHVPSASNTSDSSSMSANSSTPSTPMTPISAGSSGTTIIVNDSSSGTTPSTNEDLPLPPMSTTLNCQCGVQSVSGESIGSTVVRVMTNPWLVEIHSRTNQQLHCAGSLINNKYILTSAKCVKNLDKRSVIVTGGLQRRQTKFFTVAKIAVHPKFNEATLDNNIALLRLTEPVTPSQEMRPLCLPIHDATLHQHRFTGHLVTWVVSNPGRRRQIHLLQIEVELLNRTTCQSRINDAGDNSILPEGTMCASPPGKQDCVGGDVGGPLQVYAGRYSYEQIGLVSWSVGCRSNRFPGVYTDVRHYLRWILFQTQDGEYCRREPTVRNDRNYKLEDVFQFEQIM